jgi:hypothetical protein
MNIDNSGHVYVLISPNSEYLKIGGTNHPPLKRIKEINSTEPYRSHGPWTLYDFRHVTDWRAVEYDMHYAFRNRLVKDVTGQKELFDLAPKTAKERLDSVDPSMLLGKPRVDRMFQDQDFAAYLTRLFSFTGILNWLDAQGAWTFVLFPGTAGGRYYTINIGSHEVAFATLPSRSNTVPWHFIVMDRLIYDFPEVLAWVNARNGEFQDDIYSSALPRSVSVSFPASFDEALEFLTLDGVRRALIAYWFESLTLLKEKGVSSRFSKYHNWNAIAALRERILNPVLALN